MGWNVARRAPAAWLWSQGWKWWDHKPSSVYPLRPDGHLSGIAVASHLVRPTRSSNDPGRVSLPIWPCSDWGLPCHGRYRPRGGLLPHLFTLARKPGGLFSVALSVAFRRPGVTWQSALRSSDFPRRTAPTSTPRPSHPTVPRAKANRFSAPWRGGVPDAPDCHSPPRIPIPQGRARNHPAGGTPAD